MSSTTTTLLPPVICLPASQRRGGNAAALTKARLSVLDSHTGNYSPTEALWVYRCGPGEAPTLQSLQRSLEVALDGQGYAHFSGRLRIVTREETDPFTGHQTTGHNRHEIWWGDERSPGVPLFESTRAPEVVDDYVLADSGTSPMAAEKLATAGFVAPGPLASGMGAPSDDSGSKTDPPCMKIQLTHMACGGYILGVSAVHVLGDAATMGMFMQDWSRIHAAMAAGETPPPVTGTFQPELIDEAVKRCASHYAGAEAAMEAALALPMHRYDWWRRDGAPFDSAAMHPPRELTRHEPVRGGQTPPWAEWDPRADVGLAVVRFTAAELARLRGATAAFARGNSACAALRTPSTLDVALAHVWACIGRAKGVVAMDEADSNDDDGRLFVDNTVGLRVRLSPALPATFVGNALAVVATAGPEGWLVSEGRGEAGEKENDEEDIVPAMAYALRARLATLEADPPALAAHIYGLAREATPQRVWQAFVGMRHLLVTSWVGAGVNNVGFGLSRSARSPVCVLPVMQRIEGITVLAEGIAQGRVGEEDDEGARDGGDIPASMRAPAKWHDAGLDVSVYQRRDVLARLLQDPRLHP